MLQPMTLRKMSPPFAGQSPILPEVEQPDASGVDASRRVCDRRPFA